MPQINLSIEEHQSLTRLLSHPKTMKYRSDLYDTDTFDSMEDKVFDAVNNLTIEDFKMTRSKLEKLITDFVIQNDLDASFVQQTEGLTYVRFVVEEDFQDD